MRVGRSLLKSASGASEFICVLERKSMKPWSNLGRFMSVKAKLFEGLQSVRGVHDPAHTEKGKENYESSGNAPRINEGKRIPRVGTLCIPFAGRKKTPCPVLYFALCLTLPRQR
eukprot:1159343-Pelagomonas_calceolata.AAC.12